MIDQGELWWLEEPDAKPRPCLVLTRSSAITWLNSLTVAPLTRTIRRIDTEVVLGPANGLDHESVATFDNVKTVPRSLLTRRLGRIESGRWHEVCTAAAIAIGC
jgi:mRNA interferase MazF